MKLVDSAQMRQLDRRSIEEAGIPSLLLMENAARSVLECCKDLLSPGVISYLFCGSGNNGGDGYALARLIANHGFEAVVIPIKTPQTEGAKTNAKIFKHFGHSISFEELMETLLRPSANDLIFDAIIGTGLDRYLDSKTKGVVDWINHVQGHKIALDIPTGINSSTGDEMGGSVKAERTVSFQMEKVGHHLYPGKAQRGELFCPKVSIIEDPLQGVYHLFGIQEAKRLLPELATETYKNRQGHLGVLAGSEGMMGASVLVGKSALRCGAGLVTLEVPQQEQSGVYQVAPELMSSPRSKTTNEGLKKYQGLVVGCGLGREPTKWKQYRAWIQEFVGPVLLDADGFYGIKSFKGLGPHRMVLTPHLGEFAQLTGLPSPKTNQERIEQARNFAVREGTTLLLKGPSSLVINLDGEVWINSSGNPGLATAGSGDVLSGVIGAFLAGGLPPFDAARLGCWVHGHAADCYARQASPRGLTALQLVNQIPTAIAEIEAH